MIDTDSTAYEAVFRHVLLPASERLRGRPRLSAFLSEYEESQWLSLSEIAEIQLAKLNSLLMHAWNTVPYLRQRWAQAGLSPTPLQSVAELSRYPVLTKREITANYHEMISTVWRGRTLRKTTGGSTGAPFSYEYTHESDARRNAVMWRGYGWAGSRPGRRTTYLWSAPSPKGAVARWKERLYHAAFNRRFLDSFSMSAANLHEYADALDHVRPNIVVGYVSALRELSRWVLEQERRIWSPRALIAGAEPLAASDRTLIERAFDSRVFNTYGCREVMLIASECEHREGLHVNADHLVVETVDEKGESVAGQPGRVLLTDLHNYGMPLIRYENGDLAVSSSRLCVCGRGLPLLERIEGRILDVIKTPDGRILPGEYFPHRLKDVRGLREFQVVQTSLTDIAIMVVVDKGMDRDVSAEVLRTVGDGLGTSISLSINVVQELERTPSGKRRVTISRIQH